METEMAVTRTPTRNCQLPGEGFGFTVVAVIVQKYTSLSVTLFYIVILKNNCQIVVLLKPPLIVINVSYF